MLDWAAEHRYLLLVLALLIVAGVVGYVLIQHRRRAQVPVVAVSPTRPVMDPAPDQPMRAFDSFENRSGLSGLSTVVIFGEASDG